MNYQNMIQELESEWGKPDGFFGKLREGQFDPNGFLRVERILKQSDSAGEEYLPRRLVSLTWLGPQFMRWQRERLGEAGGDVAMLDSAVVKLENLLEGLLGVP